MSRAPQSAAELPGPLSPELARIVEAMARDMARKDHEAQLNTAPVNQAKCKA